MAQELTAVVLFWTTVPLLITGWLAALTIVYVLINRSFKSLNTSFDTLYGVEKQQAFQSQDEGDSSVAADNG